MQLSKLGLQQSLKDDDSLIAQLLEILQLVETDMTLFYRCLAELDLSVLDQHAYQQSLLNAYYQPEQLNERYWQQLQAWLEKYATRCKAENLNATERKNRMNKVNPLYVLRNYLAQLAIDKAEKGDYSAVEELMETLKAPYTEQAGKSHLAEKRPEWARNRAGCSMLSCSS